MDKIAKSMLQDSIDNLVGALDYIEDGNEKMKLQEVLELAREIRSEDNLYIWETAIKEAERIIENRKKMKAVNSYYTNYY